MSATHWPASELRITRSQAEFLTYGGVRVVSPKVTAITEDSLSRRKMLAWHPGKDGFYLGANAKGKAALDRYYNKQAKRLVAANDNKEGSKNAA
jgi:hypothetical protein